MSDITHILSQLESGDPTAANQLLPLVYDELRKLAAAKLAHESPGQTLQATALVHEAYLRLLGPTNSTGWDSRGHFFAAAAEAMRRILVENARRKLGPTQGGSWKRIEANLNEFLSSDRDDDLLDLDEGLTQLSLESPVRAELVKLRFFGGMSVPEAAQVLGVSVATAERYWTYSRAWLLAWMNDLKK